MSENSKRLLFAFVFALVFYVAGASFIQSFVNYPTWKLIGAGEFQNYHNAMSPPIIKYMIAPWLVEIILTILLLKFRPRMIPQAAIVAALMLNSVALVSTVFIQIPIQNELGENGFSAQAIEKLLATDPIRWLALIFKLGIYLWMMTRFAALSTNSGGAIET